MSDISDLFAKPPPFTPEERARVIAKYREARAQWNATGKSPRKPAAKKADAPKDKLTLGDLGEL